MFRNRKIYRLSLLRLLIIPGMAIAVTGYIPFGVNSLVPKLLVLNAALPTPSIASIIIEQYEEDTETIAQVIFMTTLFSLLTILLVLSISI